jgi:CSLREA domain-containing protein
MKRLISKVAFGISVLSLTSVGALVEARLYLVSSADSREEAIKLRKDGRGNFGINFRNGRDLRADYTGAGLTNGGNLLALEQGQVRALSLASDDINLDGFPDLICGYASVGGGLVTLHLGNPEAFGPTRPETIQSIIQGEYPDPFLAEAAVLWTPEMPEFVAAGDFDRDGHLDIITGARGSGALYLLAGDGNQGFHEPRAVPLPGLLTTMAVGQKTQTDSWADVVVGIVGPDGPALLVYETSKGVAAEGAALTYPLPAAATSVTLGRLDEDGSTDLAIIAGDRLYVLHGQDDQAANYGSLADERAGQLEPVAMPFGVKAVAVSDFIWDRDARMELAVAAEDGTVHIMRRGTLDTRPFAAGEVRARRQLVAEVRRGSRPMSDLRGSRPNRALSWEVAETTKMALSHTGDSAQPLLMSTLASGRQSHDLVVVNPGARQLQMAFREDADPGGQETSLTPGSRGEVTFDSDSQPVAALPMRLNVHARPGLVVLRQGHPEPVIVVVESHVAFNVNTATDTDDAAAGNGTCADSGGNCSLRAAIQEANVHAGADMITFSPALNGVPIQLTQTGDDNTAAQGDLDINSDITIVGNGAANTLIQGSSNAGFTGSMGDKLFGINQDGTFSTLSVSLSGLTVRFTRNSNPTIGTFTETGGAMDIFLTGTGAMPGPTTTVTNCTFDSNANQNSYGGAINIDSGDLMGGTNIFRGTVQITGSTISNNDTLNAAAAATGGGINLFADRHNVTFTNTTITGNQTSANIGSNGGGINIRHSFGGTITLNTCTISNNISGSDGGGILIAGVGAQTVNMTGGSLTGNTAQGTGASADGGGLFNANPVGGTTTLSGVTISNNTATAGADARGGGIEDGANSPLTINNCVITGNLSDNGGGVATTNAFVNQLTTITNCTISGNSATVSGGGLFILSGALTANLNRIVNNTAPSGSGIAQTGGTASVENNWWGCDGFPSAAGCQTGSGTFDADPRIDLRLLPASATLAPGGTQTFTANVSQNTNGAAINPVVLNGLTITFGGGTLGSVSPGSAALSGLTAGTLFTASSTCPTPNTGNVSATLDNGTQNSSMTVQQPPQISACPANQTVNTDPGVCTALVSFTPPTATAGCPAPTVTCRIGATPITSPHAFPVGTSTVTCTASNGVAPDASCSFTVTVNDTQNPTITCPANITATENPPGSGAAVVTYAAPVGTDACPGATTVQTAGLASGNAFPVGVTTNTFRVTDAAGNTATCSFNVTVTTPPDLSITKSHTGNFTQGQTGATYTMTVTNAGGTATSGAVTLIDNVPAGLIPTSASGAGWNCGINGAMVNCSRSDPLAPGASYGPVALTVDVAPNAPASVTNMATISGGGDVNTANNTASDVTTILPACMISCPSNITVPNDPGQCGAIVSFPAPTVTGGCGPVSCTPSSGSFFPVGTTTVTCANGAGTSCSFTVTVIDTENPVISCPANIVVTESSPGSGSAVVNYTAPVGEDSCPGATTMQTAGLASGASFPVGVTTNTFRVTDAAGNMANCSFTVTVTATSAGLLLELPESGRPVSLTLDKIPPTMSSIGIQNGNPGVLYIEIIINGRLFETVGLSNGEVKSINISSQLPLDSNTIILTGYGQPGGRANVVLN